MNKKLVWIIVILVVLVVLARYLEKSRRFWQRRRNQSIR